MYAAVEETNIGAILAVMNTAELIVKMRPEKIQVRTGFKPITSAIPDTRYCKAVILN